MPVICFIGAGKMATAIASGLKKQNYPVEIRAFDPLSSAAENFAAACGGETFASAKEALDTADIALLAVKPQYLEEALDGLKTSFEGKLVVSIVAGATIARVAELTGNPRVVRVMPNTPALVGEGMSCVAPGPGARKEDGETVRNLLTSVGKADFVQEKLLDAVTGLSGSGPAFVLEFIQSLADGGVYMGLPRAAATALALQTVLGTAKLASVSDRSVGELRNDVISPAGTTARGCMALADGKFHATVARAVIAAAERSSELGKKK